MCAIPQAAVTVAQNARCGLDAFISGFFVKSNWKNNTALPIKVYNFWVVPLVYKENGLTDAELQADFYTRHGLTADNDGSWVATNGSIFFDEPINPQKFAVLKQAHFILGGSGLANATNGHGQYPTYKRQKFWIPLNRRYTYGNFEQDGEVSERTIQAPVYYISFCVGLLEPDGTGVGVQQVQRETHHITYFRDGESGM